MEEKKVCSAVFLDVAQAFDKVWHQGLVHKLNRFLPKSFSKILNSYISERFFRVKQNESYSDLKNIEAGVPQGSVLGPVLYLLYTSDIPKLDHLGTIATFADDTAILAVGKDHREASLKLQLSLNKIQKWTTNWRIKLNESKSVHVNFTNKRAENIPVTINNTQIPFADSAKYLGITLDARLRWKMHVKNKRRELDLKYLKLKWLIGRHSVLSTSNKLLLYKQILKPVWTYGIQLWGCTCKSNLDIIQRFQNKILRDLTGAGWYVRNSDLHRDLNIDTVAQVATKFATNHKERLRLHVNSEAAKLLTNQNTKRRLKRKKPFDLIV